MVLFNLSDCVSQSVLLYRLYWRLYSIILKVKKSILSRDLAPYIHLIFGACHVLCSCVPWSSAHVDSHQLPPEVHSDLQLHLNGICNLKYTAVVSVSVIFRGSLAGGWMQFIHYMTIDSVINATQPPKTLAVSILLTSLKSLLHYNNDNVVRLAFMDTSHAYTI